MPDPKTLYKPIPFLRGSIALLTLGCFITLFSYPKNPDIDRFNILQQLALNATLFFSYSYSLYANNSPNHQPLSPLYRMSLICTAFVLSWVYGMGPLVNILGGNECDADARGFCVMQLSVSSLEVVWTVLMFAEGLLTDKRNRDKAYRQEMGWAIEEDDHVLASRARAAQAAAEANGVVEYRPDLSLEGAGGAEARAGAGRRRVVGIDDDDDVEGEEVEMEEPLPPYMPKAGPNQAVIIDMANLRLPRQRGQQTQQQQQQPVEGGDRPSSHEVQVQGQEDTQGQQEQQVDQTASRLGGVSMSSSSSSSTITPPPPAQQPPLQPAHQQQQLHPVAIHPQGGPGTGLQRVPSYSE